MTPETRILYQKAKNDLEFRNTLIAAGEKMHTPKFYWCHTLKCVYATVYLGYLIARGATKNDIYN